MGARSLPPFSAATSPTHGFFASCRIAIRPRLGSFITCSCSSSRSWTEDASRRRIAHVPDTLDLKTKPERTTFRLVNERNLVGLRTDRSEGALHFSRTSSSALAQGHRIRAYAGTSGSMEPTGVETCAAHGDFDVRTTMVIGSPTQGGTLAACAEVLLALGYPEAPTAGTRAEGDGLGLGCHVFSLDNGSAWWLGAPDFDPDAKLDRVQIACACTR